VPTRSRRDDALDHLLEALSAQGYRFVTPTPATHARVVACPTMQEARDLRGVFGWSLPFERSLVPAPLLAALEAGEWMTTLPCGRAKSLVRVSSLGERLFVHSAYPTVGKDSVFFGPDSYRFVSFVLRELPPPARHVVDLGAGSGVGGICAAARLREPTLTLSDVSPAALVMARANAKAAGIEADLRCGDGLPAKIGAPIDVLIANPPYIADSAGRTYCDGGALLGCEATVAWIARSLPQLPRLATMLVYTGSAVVNGTPVMRPHVEKLAQEHGAVMRWEELDPDVFGEELSSPRYHGVERIAAVGIVLTKL
jgi:methylase of polypeptide subunit release factors